MHSWRLVITMLLHGLDIRSEKYNSQFAVWQESQRYTSDLIALTSHSL